MEKGNPRPWNRREGKSETNSRVSGPPIERALSWRSVTRAAELANRSDQAQEHSSREMDTTAWLAAASVCLLHSYTPPSTFSLQACAHALLRPFKSHLQHGTHIHKAAEQDTQPKVLCRCVTEVPDLPTCYCRKLL